MIKPKNTGTPSTLDKAIEGTKGFADLKTSPDIEEDFNLNEELESLTNSLSAKLSEDEESSFVTDIDEAEIGGNRLVTGAKKLSSSGGSIVSQTVLKQNDLSRNTNDVEFAQIVIQKTVSPPPMFVVGWSWQETFPNTPFARDVVARVPYPVAVSLQESKLCTITQLYRVKK